MYPARQTRSTPRARRNLDDRAIVGVAIGVVAREQDRAPRGRPREPRQTRASARFETTIAIVASSELAAIASMIDCRLLPRPEMRTAERFNAARRRTGTAGIRIMSESRLSRFLDADDYRCSALLNDADVCHAILA